MQLVLSGVSEIDAPVATVWQHLMNPDFVAHCAPGVKRCDCVDPWHFKVIAGFAAGSARLVFTLDVALSDLDPGRSARMTARGKAAGSAVDVVSSVRLTSLAERKTSLEWDADATFHGTVVGVGGRLLKPVATRITRTFWKKFASGVGATPRKKRRA